MASKPIEPVFKLMWFSTHTPDLTRLQTIAKEHIMRAAMKDHFSVTRDELHWLLQKANEAQAKEAEVNFLQYKIDTLMLEHCPEDMTPEQMENYAKHQRLASESIWE
jgi:hypothetical protein